MRRSGWSISYCRSREGRHARLSACSRCPSPRRLLPLGIRCGLHQLGGTLTLLGELEPIARQLFVTPFAFFLPATIGELSAFCRVRTESFRLAVRRLNPARPIAGGGEIHGHGDLHHLPLSNRDKDGRHARV